MDVKEWARNGSFMKKPSNGWLHDDAALEHGDGVYYPVKYVGTIPMSMSMRDMSYEDRTAVTREAISQVCEAAGLRPPKKRKLPKLVKQCLPSDPVPKNYNIKLTISTTGIALVVIETNQVIANHIMPCVSFATGGDATDYDVIGYVAKDARNFREVHVFDCGHMAQDVIATVGQAFELRYKAYLRKQQQQASFGGEEAVYDEAGSSRGGQLYDDLPSAPSARRGGPAAVIPSGAAAAAMRGGAGAGRAASGGYGDVGGYSSQAIYDNRGPGVGGDYSDGYQETGGYQDTAGYMSTESMGGGYAQPPEYGGGDDDIQYGGQATYDNKMGTGVGTPRFKEYDNNYGVIPAAGGSTEYDDGMGDASAKLTQAPGGRELEKPLQQEGWFHGAVRREIADQLLRRNGDFLVRENMTVPNQFILSAMQDGKKKHILLVDPAGRVRTKDMSFSSVSHLINYHIRARIPIISQGSRISLGQPVVRIQSSGSAYDLDS